MITLWITLFIGMNMPMMNGRTRMSRIILTNNSHSLGDGQRCLKRYQYACLDQIIEKENSRAISNGTYVHEMMKLFYLSLKKGRNPKDSAMKICKWMRRRKIEDPLKVQTRFLEYVQHYDHYKWKVLGVEVGFTKILYQSASVIYVYEGKMDLIIEINGKRAWVDHKTQSRKYNYSQFENQFSGYSWALKSPFGLMNYFGLQDKVNKDTFRQDLFSYTKEQIEDWRENVIHWYDNILRAKIKEEFPKTRENCRDQYGMCEYGSLCETTNLVLLEQKKRQDYEKREYHRSW